LQLLNDNGSLAHNLWHRRNKNTAFGISYIVPSFGRFSMTAAASAMNSGFKTTKNIACVPHTYGRFSMTASASAMTSRFETPKNMQDAGIPHTFRRFSMTESASATSYLEVTNNMPVSIPLEGFQ
jgi:hypothetical protein